MVRSYMVPNEEETEVAPSCMAPNEEEAEVARSYMVSNEEAKTENDSLAAVVLAEGASYMTGWEGHDLHSLHNLHDAFSNRYLYEKGLEWASAEVVHDMRTEDMAKGYRHMID